MTFGMYRGVRKSMPAYCDWCGEKITGNPIEHIRKCGRTDRIIMSVCLCIIIASIFLGII